YDQDYFPGKRKRELELKSFLLATDQNTTMFKEVAIIRHPRLGEYTFGFITSSVVLQKENGDEELCSVYVPTNHLYIGDVFLVNSKEIIRPNLSIRESIVISYVNAAIDTTAIRFKRRI
nr:protein like COV 2 [Tanacetum cinerariifolium]